MELENLTSFPARVFTGGVVAGPLDLAALARCKTGLPEGVAIRSLLVVKCTLDYESARWEPAANQVPIFELDQEGPPFLEKDIMYQKGGVDMAVLGSARSPTGPTFEMSISVRLGKWSRSLIVFGNRRWLESAGQFIPSDPEPFTEMPVVWENAFGGEAVTDSGELAPSPLNPVGKGYTFPNRKSQIAGIPLPNIEAPGDLIRSMDDKPDPAGFGFLPMTNGLRARAGIRPGTNGVPEISTRLNNAAHPAMILPDYPAGETLEIHGMTTPSPWIARLPKLPVRVAVRGQNLDLGVPLEIDTICMWPDLKRMYLTAKGRLTDAHAQIPNAAVVVQDVEGRQ